MFAVLQKLFQLAFAWVRSSRSPFPIIVPKIYCEYNLWVMLNCLVAQYEHNFLLKSNVLGNVLVLVY